MNDDFVKPDFISPLNLNTLLPQIPETAMVKGMFIHATVAKVQKQGGTPEGIKKYQPFLDYTVREHVKVMFECAKTAYPNLTIRQAIYQLGRDAYNVFTTSLLGKVLFGIAARNFEAALRLTSRAYSLVGNLSSAVVKEQTPTSAIIHLRGVWNLPECYHVGVFEQALTDYRRQGEVTIKQHSLDEVEYKLIWS
ncbi:MAG: DUF2378 family protein [Deltaproteobacteria bacterium]|nr:DUF2378 family protein [Deltaproteobacteria bacterium]